MTDKPARWSDEWLDALMESTEYYDADSCTDEPCVHGIRAFARAVVAEAMEEAADEADDYGCGTHCHCGEKHKCVCGDAIAANIRARAKEIRDAR